MAGHAAEQLAERRRQFLDGYTDVTPMPDQAAVLAMLAARTGLDPGRGRGAPRSHTRVIRSCCAGSARHAEVRGKGAGRRWHLTGGHDGARATAGAGTRSCGAGPDAAGRDPQ